MDKNVSRRDFVKSASAAAAAAGLIAAPASANAAGAGDRIRIGFIGPGGRGFGAHVKTLAKLRSEGANIDLVAVSEVYKVQEDKVCDYIEKETGIKPKRYEDYKDMLADKDVDAVCIGTPDHWHAKQIIDALKAGKNVYCEKPMTKTVNEAMAVVEAWKSSGKVMQVGVQSTSLGVWDQARELLQAGKLGKVLGFQTEYFRNSNVGQWRYYNLTTDMNPKTINWKRWLGVDEGLAEHQDFDRAVYAQWRCYWPFGSGMYTDLFVHRTTSMLKATGLRFPGRVVGAGGIFLEYDGRQVPDVATVVADFKEGSQALITATMCNEASRIKQVIRGHHGAFEFGNGEAFTEFEFIAERPQVTLDSKIKSETIKTGGGGDTTYAHFKNWLEAMKENKPASCNNPPDLGAAAIAVVVLGAMSYRTGKVYHFDEASKTYSEGDASWSQRWENMSAQRAKPLHATGWKAGDTGSLLVPPKYMELAGPWKNGVPPEEAKKG
ncbi:MAG: Gfo/Idh/MocA family oxidoreductase [Planctomycetaceae bacterium]|nr:Gfo/Idh/MocA family oxidoreductase [Planctomycetaceae bacterium]